MLEARSAFHEKAMVCQGASLCQITESGVEHAHAPIPYVRSFYLLGTLHEKRGKMDEARELYSRFLGSWRDGDLDREWVATAKNKL